MVTSLSGVLDVVERPTGLETADAAQIGIEDLISELGWASVGLECPPVPQYTVGEAADLLGVSADTVRRLADRGELKVARTPGGRRRLDGAALARYAQKRATAGVEPKRNTESARNRLSGLVTKVTKDKVMAQVEIQAGPFRVVSLMSREAADELALAPGSLVVAVVKSTNVVVEVPES
jgi:molybdopterin-binding protein